MKIPPLLLTITVLASFATTLSASATTSDGPWLFDEVFAARAEVKDWVNQNCSESIMRSTCANQYKLGRGGIYEHGVQLAQNQQLIPVSIDFAANTLEYHYNTEDIERNFDWRPPFKDIYVTKLTIIQLESDYQGAWTNEIRVSDTNPHWKTLYSATVPEGENNLLASDQKGIIHFEHPSFDPEYDKFLRIFYQKSNGETRSLMFDFRKCTDGRKYNAWYDGRINPYIYFEDPSYDDGYTAGYNAGYNEGSNTGHNSGYDEGYNEGYDTGNDSGYNSGYNDGSMDGYDEGHAIGKQEGYEIGYEEGYQDGLARGEDMGYNQGFFEGQNIGYDEGFNHGRSLGQSEGRDIGYNEGYNNGLSEGYNTGYNEGFLAGQADSTTSRTDNGEGQSNQDNLTDSNAPSDQNNTNGQTSQGNQDNQNSHLETTTSTTSNAKFIPDTGYPTQENNTSTELPWWLSVIFIIGIATVLWLFIPNHKKRQKK